MVAIAATVLLMAGSIAAAATMNLFSERNPDPYEHSLDYSVSGSVGGDSVTGSATCKTIHENGSFHNYVFDAKLFKDETVASSDSFLIIFEPNDTPSFLDAVGTEEVEGQTATIYKGTVDGKDIEISVADHCKILKFSIVSGDCEYSGSVL